MGLQHLINTKGKEIAGLENQLKNKDTALRNNAAQSVEVMKIKDDLDKNKEKIKSLQQLVNAKDKRNALLEDELKANTESLKRNVAQVKQLMNNLRAKEEVLNSRDHEFITKNAAYSDKIEMLNLKEKELERVESELREAELNLRKDIENHIKKQFEITEKIDAINLKQKDLVKKEYELMDQKFSLNKDQETFVEKKLEFEKNDEMIRVLQQLFKRKEEIMLLESELNVKEVLSNDPNNEWKSKEETLIGLLLMLGKGLKRLNRKKVHVSEKIELIDLKEHELKQREQLLESGLVIGKDINQIRGVA